eukprot:scaffold7314_cov140-Amphora_coffeaeformis.AAC.1
MAGATSPSEERPRKTKLEKIAELESDLKLLKEENRLHKKEIKNLKGLGNNKTLANPYEDRIPDSDDVEKMKTALKSLKRVTVKQEMSLQSMRESANDRRRQLVEKDERILKLKQQLRSMEKTMKSMQRGESNEDLHERIRDLEMKYFDARQKNADLRQRAEKSEAMAKHLEKKMSTQQTPFNSSTPSTSSDASDSDLTRIKQQLAKKSSRIVSLEYELETTKEELEDLRRQTGNNNGSFGSLQSSFQSSFQGSFTLGDDGFPCAPPMGADPFKPTDPFYGSANDDNLFASSGDEESEFDDRS